MVACDFQDGSDALVSGSSDLREAGRTLDFKCKEQANGLACQAEAKEGQGPLTDVKHVEIAFQRPPRNKPLRAHVTVDGERKSQRLSGGEESGAFLVQEIRVRQGVLNFGLGLTDDRDEGSVHFEIAEVVLVTRQVLGSVLVIRIKPARPRATDLTN